MSVGSAGYYPAAGVQLVGYAKSDLLTPLLLDDELDLAKNAWT